MTSFAEATIAVLFGGRSSERSVSLASGRAILDALREEVASAERLLAVEILADGRWQIGADRPALDAPAALAELTGVDLFFLGLHGGEGENGTIQGFLKAAGHRFTGSGVGPSATCMDKTATRTLVAEIGVEVARAELVAPWDWPEARDPLLARLESWPATGLVIKPRRGGSSVATTVIETLAQAPAAIERVFEDGDEALIEERIEGVEVTCPCLGNRDSEPRVLPLVEIRPKPGRFFDFEEKYSTSGAQELCPPESLSDQVCAEVRRLGAAVHRHLRLDGLSRSDFIVREEAPIFLEVNTLPGMLPRSLFPQAAAQDGLAFPALCRQIAELGLRSEA